MNNSQLTAFAGADRREFMQIAAASSVTIAGACKLGPMSHALGNTLSDRQDRFCGFTESFQTWPIDVVCAKFKEVNLDGLDLTVRPGGHIDPKAVTKELPAAVAAAEKHGVHISMLTSAITDADRDAESILATAGNVGIKFVKLGYYRVQRFGALLKEIDQVRRRIESVSKLARKHGVLPCVHIHSGEIIPASGPTAYLLLREFPPGEVGAYVDPMHMTVEGGLGGWRQGLDLLAPWIAISSLKNFTWEPHSRDERGQMRWRIAKRPLADGVAPIPDYLAALRELGYRGLYSLHSEYRDQNSWKQLTVGECLNQTAQDHLYAKQFLS